MGVGTADADARSTRADAEAGTSKIYESQRRLDRVGVGILKPLRWSRHRRVIRRRLAP